MMLARKLFTFLPEYWKDQVRCIYYSFTDSGFKLRKRKRLFEVFVNGRKLKFINQPGHDMYNTLKGYYKYRMPKKGDTVIDCGAYQGVFSVYSSILVGEKGKVYAFEPVRDNFELMIANIRLNKLHNIVPINKGIWSNEETLKFSRKKDFSSCIGVRAGEEYMVTRLDKELEKIKKVDFLKMDVEGAEIEGLNGARNFLNRHEPYVMVATYHIINKRRTRWKVEEILKEIGFRVRTSHKRHLTTYGEK